MTSDPARRALIITADDFGLHGGVNEAVELAHRDGVLNAASLMVGASAAADAVVERAMRRGKARCSKVDLEASEEAIEA